MAPETVERDAPNPAMLDAIRRIRAAVAERRSAAGDDMAARRAAQTAATDLRPTLPDDAHFEEVDAGGVPADWVWADNATEARAVVYFHGGGFIGGTSAHSRLSNAAVSRVSQARFLSVNYRLAPEFPFPAAVDDAVTAYRWLLDAGRDPAAIAFAGTSAGGNIALAALVAAEQQGLPLPGAAFVVCPVSDLTFSCGYMTDAEIANTDNTSGVYLDGHDRTDPVASPALADMSAWPPLHVEVGTADMLLGDNRQLVARARAAGVDAALYETKGGIHSFIYAAPETDEAKAAVARIGAFLDRTLA